LPYSVSVGQTARTPEERFAQHLIGVRSNRRVREYGVRLRPRPCAKVSPFETRAHSEAAETTRAEKLRRRGRRAARRRGALGAMGKLRSGWHSLVPGPVLRPDGSEAARIG